MVIASQNSDTDTMRVTTAWREIVSELPRLTDEELVRLRQQAQRLLNERSSRVSSNNTALTSAAGELSNGASVACSAFRHDLPQLCADSQLYDRWVLYVGDGREDVADTKRELIHKCNARGLAPNDYFIGYVDDAAALDFESGDIDLCDVNEPDFGEEPTA